LRDKTPFIKCLYAIIDSTYAPLELAGEYAGSLAEGGAKIIQLRAKGTPGAILLKAAQEARKALPENALFIVNDRIDIAMLSGAQGVHLGQDDIPLKEARRLLPSSIIGVSTHNMEEAKRAAAEGADYISFGPIFPTRTKGDADTPKGLEALHKIASSIGVPVVAIGGITEATALSVLRAGASSIAIISDILLATDIREKTSAIAAIIEKG